MHPLSRTKPTSRVRGAGVAVAAAVVAVAAATMVDKLDKAPRLLAPVI